MSAIAQVLDERGKRYGQFKDHAYLTQRLKIQCRHHQNGDKWAGLTHSQREAIDMILHKVGRIMNGDPNYVDSWVDICGYSQLIVDELQGQGNEH